MIKPMTPRTANQTLRRPHLRPSVIGTVPILEDPGPYSALTVTNGKPMRPDLRSYPVFVGQGPEAQITSA